MILYFGSRKHELIGYTNAHMEGYIDFRNQLWILDISTFVYRRGKSTFFVLSTAKAKFIETI